MPRYAPHMASQPTMQISIGSVKATLYALEHTTANMDEAARVALEAAAKVLLKHARKVLSLTDHRLRDLEVRDHPYATRHGRVRVHTSTPWKVHTHTGRLLRSLKDVGYDVGDAPAHMVYLDTSEAPHARYVVEGTERMLPRDPLWTGTALQPTVQKQVMSAIVKVMGKELRTKVGVRFGSVGGSGTVL